MQGGFGIQALSKVFLLELRDVLLSMLERGEKSSDSGQEHWTLSLSSCSHLIVRSRAPGGLFSRWERDMLSMVPCKELVLCLICLMGRL